MKVGDVITLMWQSGASHAVIGGGLCYVTSDGKELSDNELRCIWELLNKELPIESKLKNDVPLSSGNFVVPEIPVEVHNFKYKRTKRTNKEGEEDD